MEFNSGFKELNIKSASGVSVVIGITVWHSRGRGLRRSVCV